MILFDTSIVEGGENLNTGYLKYKHQEVPSSWATRLSAITYIYNIFKQ